MEGSESFANAYFECGECAWVGQGRDLKDKLCPCCGEQCLIVPGEEVDPFLS